MPSKEIDAGMLKLRRSVVFRARSEQRLTFRQIATSLERGITNPVTGEPVTFEISPRTVRDDYYIVLRESGYVPDPTQVEEQRAEELLKLDKIEDAYWDRAVGFTKPDGTVIEADSTAANLVLRAQRQRAQLAGLNQVRISGPDGGPIPIELSVPDDVIAGILRQSLERAETAAAQSMN